MRILVTGAAGFIGSHLCEGLLAEGHEVIGMDGFIPSYPRPYKEANLIELLAHPQFRFVEADLRVADLDRLVEGVSAVVNLAAMPGLPRSWTEMDLYAGCNLLAVERLVTAARRADVARFVQVSTSSVYGRSAVGDEQEPTAPVSPYGVTKLAAEHLVLAHAHEHGLPAIVLRYFSIYGPRQRPDMAYRIFSERLLRGEPLVVYGNGSQSRSNTYVSDCVSGTIAALHEGQLGEVYNIGGGQEIQLLDAIELLADAVGVRPRIEFAPARPGDQRRTVADTSKARAHFGYRALVEPCVGLRHQFEWVAALEGLQTAPPVALGRSA